MHSEWIIARRISDRRAPKEWLAQHLSSGRRTPVDPEELQGLAEEIGMHADRFRRIWHFAVRAVPVGTAADWERRMASLDLNEARADEATEPRPS
jgi:hypothetical protein